MDYLPLISVIVAKGIRKLGFPIRTTVNYIKHHMIISTSTKHEDADQFLRQLIAKSYLNDISDNIDLVAKVMQKENEVFDITSLQFWRTFLRFKHLKKMLERVVEEDEPLIDDIEKVMSRILDKPTNVQVSTNADHKDEIHQLLKHDLFLQKSKKEPIFNYGYGHHRINVTEELQNSHACIMMNIPNEMPIEHAQVISEIMNSGRKVIFLKFNHF